MPSVADLLTGLKSVAVWLTACTLRVGLGGRGIPMMRCWLLVVSHGACHVCEWPLRQVLSLSLLFFHFFFIVQAVDQVSQYTFGGPGVTSIVPQARHYRT